MRIETKTKNINNKTLYKQIDDFLMEVFENVGADWHLRLHRESIAEMIDDWMSEILINEEKKIIQYDVMCDSRNNSEDDMRNGMYKFTLRYRQKNCYNTTEIEYTIHV